MSNDNKKLYLVYYEDPAYLPLPIWLTNEEYLDCLNLCKKPHKFELIGFFDNGQFRFAD